MRARIPTRLILTAAIVVATIACSLAALRIAVAHAERQDRALLEHVAEGLSLEMEQATITAESAALLRGITGPRDVPETRRMAQVGARRPGNHTFSLLKPVAAGEREAWQARSGALIYVLDPATGQRRPSSGGQHYVVEATSARRYQGLVGFDLGQQPGYAEALNRALVGGVATVTPPMRSWTGGPGMEVMVLRPVDSPDFTRGRGVVAVTVEPADFTSLHNGTDRLHVFDGDAAIVGGLSRPPRGITQTVPVEGREWQVVLEPSAPSIWMPLTVAVFGTLLAFAVGATLWADARRERDWRSAVDRQVDEQVRARSALHREQEYAQAVVRALQDGMLVLDADGTVVEANRRICEMTGCAREQLVGARAPLPFWPSSESRATTTSEAYNDVLAADHVTREAEFRRGSGSRLWMSLTSASLHDDEGAHTGRVVTFKNVTARYLAEHEKRVRERTDQLTGLANHSVFQERLSEEADRSLRQGTPLALVLFDIDHLKRINQVHGHHAGDEVLREVSRRVMSCIRPTDLFARVGGEKFALLMPGVPAEDAYNVAERARATLGIRPFSDVGGVTLSAGVGDMHHARSGAELYKIADGARYWAKTIGRDTCVLWDPETVSVTSADEYQAYLERQSVMSTIQALAKAVDAKDVTTREHSERVASLSARIALELGWSTHRTDLLYEAGLVHDVGKIGIPDAVLFKPGRLTEDEYEQIKTHAALGAQIVAGMLSEEQVSWVRAHHERWNGGGYPDGLVDEQIPEGARIMALADAWDVMTIARVYSQARSLDDAIAEIERESGRQFWPPAVAVLVRLAGDGLVDIPAPPPPENDVPLADRRQNRGVLEVS